MIYTEPHWDKMFLQLSTLDKRVHTPNEYHEHWHEYRIWGDTLHELIEYAHEVTPGLVLANSSRMVEYLIWDGVPSPTKPAVYKWTYSPTIPKDNE